MPRAAPRGWLTPPPAWRSGAGPTRLPCSPAVPAAVPSPARAADAVPDFAERPHRASGVCSSRSVSPALRSAAIAGPAAGSSGPIPRARWRRSPPCDVVSERPAPRASSASGGEPRAPLCATPGEHAATTLRSHASAEAVFPLPGALLGLVCPLHRGVRRPRSAAASSIPPETHERLASRQPHASAVSGRLALPGDSTPCGELGVKPGEGSAAVLQPAWKRGPSGSSDGIGQPVNVSARIGSILGASVSS